MTNDLIEDIAYLKHDDRCWIQLYSGTKFFLLNPRMEDIYITDIAHSLSQLCRFNGNCSSFYSVAQHSVLVSYNCKPENALSGLLHDASEGMGLGDVVTPLKQSSEFEFYRKIEHNLQSLIYKKFGVTTVEPEDVKMADSRALATECRDLMQPLHKDWTKLAKPFDTKIKPLPPELAEKEFLARFYELVKDKDA